VQRRRAFLKAVASAGLATAASSHRVLGANDRVRVGVIGVGLIGKRHLIDFLAEPDCDVVGVCEVYTPRLEEGLALAGAKATGCRDFRKMLDRPDVDAVVVSTPDHWHAPISIFACAAGKDVYVEKPLTHVVREGRWMVQAARHHRRIVQVGTQQRSGAHFKRCVDLIRNGHIGDVRSVRLASRRNIAPGFTRPVGEQPLSPPDWDMWLGPAPYVPFEPTRCIYHFRWFWDYSGGQTTNLLAHDIDVVQWATGELPRAVAAMGGRYSLRGIGETPDVFEALFEYPSFVATWSDSEVSAGRGPGLSFCGTRGTLTINRVGLEVIPDPDLPPDAQIPRFTEPASPAGEAPPGLRTAAVTDSGYEQVRDQFKPHVRNFLDCVKSRQLPAADVEGGHRSVTSCHLANIALKLKRTVRWDPDKEDVVGDADARALLTKTYRAPWDRELRAALPPDATWGG
jgi:predicted dehydrogenase